MTLSIEQNPNQMKNMPVTISDLPDAISKQPKLSQMADVKIPTPLKEKAPKKLLKHREFDDTEFWKCIPAFKNVSREEFQDHSFQLKNTAKNSKQLRELLTNVATEEFLNDMEKGLEMAPMTLRISPYLLSLIDWDNPYEDPIRIQFIPVASKRQSDHPMLTLDSLNEQQDSPVSGLVHRYTDKALFLPLDVCPVYCRFCTRSYAIGSDTDEVNKVSYNLYPKRWQPAFAYIASRPEIEDIVISGGDAYLLSPKHIQEIGEALLEIPHIRRIRFASKGPAVMPMKILSDHKWTEALTHVYEFGKKRCKEVVLHTHFNSPHEITSFSLDALNLLFKKGITVRNQSVLIRGVNDSVETMRTLVKQLSFMNVQPYYVYQHDMVKGVEDMRTSIHKTQEIERQVRGFTAGFNTPTFVCDVPGGGGKRDIHSYDYYNRTTGIAVYRSPSVSQNKLYYYFDPIASLPKEGQERWSDSSQHEAMIQEAKSAAESNIKRKL